jgi:UDP-hydrolysing UDP-N-acetyl-D-glucosamine 2-epimerase
VRRVAVVTVGRSDYGIYRPVLRRIVDDPELELGLVVAGAHVAHGSVAEIESDGFPIAARIDVRPDDDRPVSAAVAAGRMSSELAEAYERIRPDLVLALGDRYEMLAAVAAAVPLGLPIAHIHGGELTEGAIDDAVRHAITKLSHLHFVATEEYAARVRRLGEESWRVTVSGAPALDNLELLAAESGPEVDEPFLLATWHPVTLEPDDAERQLDALLGALADAGTTVVFTHPNADPGRAAIVEAIERSGARVFPSLGTRDYFALMRRAAAMVGNSSSGIVEAASFGLPVVNVGSRQRGRVRGANVIDVEPERGAIAGAIAEAISPEFRARVRDLQNPYGDGHAAERIVARLKAVPLGRELLVKRFEEAA